MEVGGGGWWVVNRWTVDMVNRCLSCVSLMVGEAVGECMLLLLLLFNPCVCVLFCFTPPPSPPLL